MYYPKHTDSLTLDYTIGTCLILIFLVSTTLNPLSFLYHIQRDSKLSSRLYALLALLDLIVNICSPLFQAHNFFKETEDSSRKSGIKAEIIQGITHPSAWLSQIVINIIIFARLFTIKFPFRRVKQKLVWICISFLAVYLVVLDLASMRYHQYWHSELQIITRPRNDIHPSNVMSYSYIILLLIPMATIHILGGMSSIYTVFLLTRDTGPSETREQKRKSVRIILTLSIINWTAPLAIIYTNFNWPKENSTTAELVGAYTVINGMKKFVSATDPVIILVLSNDLRVYCMNCINACFQKICSAVMTLAPANQELDEEVNHRN